MLCSGVELGLNEDLYPGAGYNGLLVLPEDAKVGDDVKPILGLDDWIFDIAITANRPDCQCIYGMAREVAAVLGKELKEPALDYTADDVKKENFKVSVLAQDICPRYTAHLPQGMSNQKHALAVRALVRWDRLLIRVHFTQRV